MHNMSNGQQVKNGKAFEYAIAVEYQRYLNDNGYAAKIVENEASAQAKGYYDSFSEIEKQKYNNAAYETIRTMILIEPGLIAPKNQNDVLSIYLQKDQEGEYGDVRDVVFQRKLSAWEIGFSAKNNNDDVKHNRLSDTIDFGEKWNLGEPCSETYWNKVKPIFKKIRDLKANKPSISWDDIGADVKVNEFYLPLLDAFREEVLRIAQNHSDMPQRLVAYLVGNYPFYKIIKDDTHKLVVVKSFNFDGTLNKTVNGVRSRYKTPKILFPTRIIEFKMDEKHPKDTLVMVLNEGWEIGFRIHSADNPIVPSFKFAIKLLGNPPILFTQHLFQENQ